MRTWQTLECALDPHPRVKRERVDCNTQYTRYAVLGCHVDYKRRL